MNTIMPPVVMVSFLSRGKETHEKRGERYRLVIDGLLPLRKVEASIRGSQDLKRKTEQLRQTLAKHGRKGAYAQAKKGMPAIVPAMQASEGTLLGGLPVKAHHNGLYGYDIDEQRQGQGLDLLAVRQALIEAQGAVMVGTSCAGDALYAIFAGPIATDEKDYLRHWEAIGAAMPPGACVASGVSSKNSNRLRFLAHDPDVWVAGDAVTPLAGAAGLFLPPTPTTTPAPQGDDHAIDIDALRFIHPPDGGGDANYNSWISWLRTLKRLGFSAEEAEEWSSQGANYEKGQVLSRWEGLESNKTVEEERHKLRGHAHNLGWREKRPTQRHTQAAAPPARGLSETSKPSGAALAEDSRPYGVWFAIAAWWQRTHSHGCWVYCSDPRSFGWWWYDGLVWHSISDTDPRLLDIFVKYRYRYAAELKDMGREQEARALAEQFNQVRTRGDTSDLWAALRDACRGEVPSPEDHYEGTPDCIVDLRDGSIHAHAPEFGMRSITRGRYRPGDAKAQWEALHRRFDKVFDEDILLAYLRLIALDLTGLAQSYRSFKMVYGESGSGKGGACKVLLNALGDRCFEVASNFLVQRHEEIDSTMTTMLEKQPAVILIDELSSEATIPIHFFLSLTGNTGRGHRRPHGQLIDGTIKAGIWTTATEAPNISRKKDVDRRMAVLPTRDRKIPDEEIDEAGGKDQLLLDAIVTQACILAAEVYRQPYHPPEGSRASKRKALDEMDDVGAWLDQQDDLDGKFCADVRVQVLDALRLSPASLSAKALGSRVKSSLTYTTKHTKRGSVIIRRPTPMDLQDAPRPCPQCGGPAPLAGAELEFSPAVQAGVLCSDCAAGGV